MDTHALLTRWRKARHYYASLFRELEIVQRKLGHEAYADWCVRELGISVGVLKKATILLAGIDARIAREQQQLAVQAQRLKRARERALVLEEKERIRLQKKEEAKRERKRANDRAYRAREREKKKQLQVAAE